MMLLVHRTYWPSRRPGERFAPEVAAARDARITVFLVDHDALTQPDGTGQAVAQAPICEGDAVYRGWMLDSQQYAAFETALRQREVMLCTNAAACGGSHELLGLIPGSVRYDQKAGTDHQG